MTTFLLTLTITFVLLLVAGITISYCKRRQSATSHGLTGMCHETGGTMCGCCSSRLHNFRRVSTRHTTCDAPRTLPTTRES